MTTKNNVKKLFLKTTVAIFVIACVFCAIFGLSINKGQKNIFAEQTSSQQTQEQTSENFIDSWDNYASFKTDNQNLASDNQNTGSIDTDNKVIKISTPQNLAAISAHSNGKTVQGLQSVVPNDFENYTIYIINDIDMSGKYWTPICATVASNFQYDIINQNDANIKIYSGFKGKIYGGGHKITGLMVDPTADYNVTSYEGVLYGQETSRSFIAKSIGAVIADIIFTNTKNLNVIIGLCDDEYGKKTTDFDDLRDVSNYDYAKSSIASNIYTDTCYLWDGQPLGLINNGWDEINTFGENTSEKNGVNNVYYEILGENSNSSMPTNKKISEIKAILSNTETTNSNDAIIHDIKDLIPDYNENYTIAVNIQEDGEYYDSIEQKKPTIVPKKINLNISNLNKTDYDYISHVQLKFIQTSNHESFAEVKGKVSNNILIIEIPFAHQKDIKITLTAKKRLIALKFNVNQAIEKDIETTQEINNLYSFDEKIYNQTDSDSFNSFSKNVAEKISLSTTDLLKSFGISLDDLKVIDGKIYAEAGTTLSTSYNVEYDSATDKNLRLVKLTDAFINMTDSSTEKVVNINLLYIIRKEAQNANVSYDSDQFLFTAEDCYIYNIPSLKIESDTLSDTLDVCSYGNNILIGSGDVCSKDYLSMFDNVHVIDDNTNNYNEPFTTNDNTGGSSLDNSLNTKLSTSEIFSDSSKVVYFQWQLGKTKIKLENKDVIITFYNPYKIDKDIVYNNVEDNYYIPYTFRIYATPPSEKITTTYVSFLQKNSNNTVVKNKYVYLGDSEGVRTWGKDEINYFDGTGDNFSVVCIYIDKYSDDEYSAGETTYTFGLHDKTVKNIVNIANITDGEVLDNKLNFRGYDSAKDKPIYMYIESSENQLPTDQETVIAYDKNGNKIEFYSEFSLTDLNFVIGSEFTLYALHACDDPYYNYQYIQHYNQILSESFLTMNNNFGVGLSYGGNINRIKRALTEEEKKIFELTDDKIYWVDSFTVKIDSIDHPDDPAVLSLCYCTTENSYNYTFINSSKVNGNCPDGAIIQNGNSFELKGIELITNDWFKIYAKDQSGHELDITAESEITYSYEDNTYTFLPKASVYNADGINVYIYVKEIQNSYTPVVENATVTKYISNDGSSITLVGNDCSINLGYYDSIFIKKYSEGTYDFNAGTFTQTTDGTYNFNNDTIVIKRTSQRNDASNLYEFLIINPYNNYVLSESPTILGESIVGDVNNVSFIPSENIYNNDTIIYTHINCALNLTAQGYSAIIKDSDVIEYKDILELKDLTVGEITTSQYLTETVKGIFSSKWENWNKYFDIDNYQVQIGDNWYDVVLQSDGLNQDCLVFDWSIKYKEENQTKSVDLSSVININVMLKSKAYSITLQTQDLSTFGGDMSLLFGEKYDGESNTAKISFDIDYFNNNTLKSFVGKECAYDMMIPGYDLNKSMIGGVYELSFDSTKKILDECINKNSLWIELCYEPKDVNINFNFDVLNLKYTYDKNPNNTNFKFDQIIDLNKVDLIAILNNVLQGTLYEVNSLIYNGQIIYPLEQDDLIIWKQDDFDHENGSTSYEVNVKTNLKAMSFEFDNTFLNDETNPEGLVDFNTSKYSMQGGEEGKVVTPTRAGFTFKYWKATINQKDYYIYTDSDGVVDEEKSTKFEDTTFQESTTIVFYAYWSWDESGLNVFNNLQAEYNASQQKFVIVNWQQSILQNAKYIFSIKDNLGFSLLTDSTNAQYRVSVNLIYAEIYEFQLNVKPDFSTSIGASSKEYVLNSQNSKDFNIKITITTKQISVQGQISKVFDSTTSVINEFSGIYPSDEENILINASYENSNVGKNKNIVLAFAKKDGSTLSDDDYNKIINSYNLPKNVIGEITPFVFVVNMKEGSSSVQIDPNTKVSLGQIVGSFNDLNKIEWALTSSYFTFNNLSDLTGENLRAFNVLSEKLKSIQIKILTSSGSGGSNFIEYAQNNSDSKLIYNYSLTFKDNITEEDKGNIEVKIEGKHTIFVLTDGQKGFDFGVFDAINTQLEKFEISIDQIENESIFTYPGSDKNYTKLNERKYYVLKDLNANQTVKFNILVENAYKDYWIKNVVIKNSVGETLEIEYSLSGLSLTFALNQDVSSYVIDVILTNESNVYVNYIIPQQDLYYESTKIIYSSLISENEILNKSLTHQGFVFDGLALDLEGTQMLASDLQAKWNIKQNVVVLYAIWHFDTSLLQSTGSDITKTYDGQESYIVPNVPSLSITGLNLNISWKKLDTSSANLWKTVSQNLIKDNSLEIKNVIDSGIYAFELQANLNTNIVNVEGKTNSKKINLQKTNDLYQKTIVNISKFELILNAIDKVFDGINTKIHKMSEADFAIAQGQEFLTELYGKQITVKYLNSTANSTLSSLTVEESDSLLQNYDLKATGTIVKRHLIFNVNASIPYIDNVVTTRANSITDLGQEQAISYVQNDLSFKVEDTFRLYNTYFAFNEIKIKTNDVNVGVYKAEDNALTLEVSLVDFVFADNITYEIVGNVNITPLEILLDNVQINNQKYYNTQTQNITFEDVTITSLTDFNVEILNKDKKSVFTGAKNVGDYEVVIKISKQNYTDLYVSSKLCILPLQLTLNITQILKEYDGNTKADISSDKFEITKAVYQNLGQSLQLTLNDTLIENLKSEILNSFNFDFESKDAQENLKILSSLKNQNYKNLTLDLSSSIGIINKKDITLNINNANLVYDLNNNYQISYENVSSEQLLERITAGYINFDYENYVADNTQFKTGEILLNNSLVQYFKSNITLGLDNLSKNYNITGLAGSVNISKANVILTLIGSNDYANGVGYEYNGQIVVLDYKITIKTNGEDLYLNKSESLKYVNVLSEAKNVGNYSADASIKTSANVLEVDWSKYLNVDTQSSSLSFDIYKKAVTISVENSKYYDTQVLRYNLSNSDFLNNFGLCTGHSIKGTLTTKHANVGEYNTEEDGIVISEIEITDGSQIDVTENYDITINAVLKILKSQGTVDEENSITNFIYDGSDHAQELNISIYYENSNKINVTFNSSLINGYKIWQETNNLGPIDYLNYINKSKAESEKINEIMFIYMYYYSGGQIQYTIDLSEMKYASNYELRIYSTNFSGDDSDYVIANALISPKILNASDIISSETAKKQYDGTNSFNKTIDLADLKDQNSQNLFVNTDASYLKLTGEYSNVFGNVDLILNLQLNNQETAGSLENSILHSYVIEGQLSTQIVQRKVVFEYIGENKYYYTNSAIEINIDSFKYYDEKETIFGVINEYFAGSIIFKPTTPDAYDLSLLDKNNFDLSGLSVNCKTLGYTSDLSYYDISFAGVLEINKAIITVSLHESPLSVVYDGNEQSLITISQIKNGCGFLSETDQYKVAKVIFKQNNIKVSAKNVGKYDIEFSVNNNFANYYQIEEKDTTTEQIFEINQRIIKIYLKQECFKAILENSNFAVELSNSIIFTDNENYYSLVNGHVLSGRVETTSNNVGTYVYNPDNSVSGIVLKSIQILKDAEDVTGNYDILYDIALTISDQISASVANITVSELIYNGQDQKSKGIFTVTCATDYSAEIISENSISYYLNEACTISTNELKNAGTYYAKIDLSISYMNNEASVYTSNAIKIVIKPKSLQSFKNLDGTAFDGNSIYNTTNMFILTSDQIIESDKDIITIKAEYNGTEVGSYLTDIKITENELITKNYEVQTKFVGQINPRPIELYFKNDIYETLYTGNYIIITSSNFICDTLLMGHLLGGSILVEQKNVGTYTITSANGIVVKNSELVDISTNYLLKIKDNQTLKINTVDVELTLSQTQYSYNANDQKDYIIKNITNNNALFNNQIKETLINFKDNLFEIKYNNLNNSVIVNAGEYEISLRNNTCDGCNFNFIFSAITIEILKAEATININSKVIPYGEYSKAKGYNILASDITGLFDGDENITGKIVINKTSIKVQEKYLSSDLICQGDITNNYDITIIGSLMLSADDTAFVVEDLIYNGHDYDLFEDLVVKDSNGNQVSKTLIEKSDTSILFNTVNPQNPYFINITIAEGIIYQLLVKILPKEIVSIKDSSLIKDYDGTTVVFNDAKETEILSNDFVVSDMGEIYLNANYVSFMAGQNITVLFELKGQYASNYKLNLGEKTGSINKKAVTLNLNETLIYNISEKYEIDAKDKFTNLASTDKLNKLLLQFSSSQIGSTLNVSIFNVSYQLDIKNGEVSTQDCYDIKFAGTISINPRPFKVELTKPDNLEFNNYKKFATCTILEDGYTLTNSDKEEIQKGIVISYTKNLLTFVGEPWEVGNYKAEIVYSLQKYTLTSQNDCEFTITPFVFEINNENAPKIQVYEDDIKNEYIVNYSISFIGAQNYPIEVTFERTENLNTLGYHSLKYKSVNTSNITISAIMGALDNSLEILPSLTQTLMVELKSYKNGEFSRQYGVKDIGVFDLTDFTFEAKVGSKTLNEEELGLLSLQGKIIFNYGDVGNYSINSSKCELTSSYKNISVSSDLELKVVQREIKITLNEGQSYDKDFDGTNKFISSYTTSLTREDGTIIPNFKITYESVNAGKHNLVSTLNNNYKLIYEGNEQGKATINKLNVNLNLDDEYEYGSLKATDSGIIIDNYQLFANDGITELSKFKSEIVLSVKDPILSTANYLSVGDYILSYQSENLNVTLNTNSIKISQKLLTAQLLDADQKVISFDRQEDGTDKLNGTISLVGVMTGDQVNTLAKYLQSTPGNTQVKIELFGNDAANYNIELIDVNIFPKSIQITFVFNPLGLNMLDSEISSNISTVEEYGYYTQLKTIPTLSHTLNGYSFIGWEDKNGNEVVFDNQKSLNEIISTYQKTITLNAKWQINKFQIKFSIAKYNPDNNEYVIDNSLSVNKEYDYKQNVDISQFVQEIANYKFEAYEIDNKITTNSNFIVTKVQTVKLLYMLNKYTVTFNKDALSYFNNTNNNLNINFSNQSATVLVFHGYKIDFVEYLNLSKTGYTHEGWSLATDTTNTKVDFNSYKIQGPVEFNPILNAKSYTITLDALDGEFKDFDEAIWQYVQNNENPEDKSKIKTSIKFDQDIIEFITPSWYGYDFDKWIYMDQEFSQNKYIFDQDITITAAYLKAQRTLSVIALNSNTIQVKETYDNQSQILTGTKIDNGLKYTVYVLSQVEITVEAKEGYLIWDNEKGYEKLVKTQNGFDIDTTIKFVILPRENEVTLTLNSTKYGKVSIDEQEDINGVLQASVVTENDLVFVLNINKGYSLKEIIIDTTNKQEVAISANNITTSQIEYTIKNIKYDTNVNIVLEPIEIELKFEFEKTKILFNNVYYEATFTQKIKVEEIVEFETITNYGYEVVLTNIEFISQDQEAGGQFSLNNNKFVFENFKASGTIKIIPQKQTFSLTVKYGEYDDLYNQVMYDSIPAKAYLLINNNQSEFGEIKFEYEDVVNLSSTFEQGYELYLWQILDNSKYKNLSNSNDFELNITKDIVVYLIAQRRVFDLEFKVQNDMGFVIDNQNEYKSIVQKVRYERDAKEIKAKVDGFMNFVGWYDEQDQLLTENFNIKISNIKQNSVFVAKFEGQSIDVDFTINLENSIEKYNLTQDEVNNLISVQSGFDLQVLSWNESQVAIKIKGYKAYDDASIKISLPERYKINNIYGASITADNLLINKIIPNMATASGSVYNVIIDLQLKQISVVLKQTINSAVSVNLINDFSYVAPTQTELKGDLIISEYLVSYGFGIKISYQLSNGIYLKQINYAYEDSALGQAFVKDEKAILYMQDIVCDTTATFEVEYFKYQLNFNLIYLNMPTKTLVYYLNHQYAEILDANGNVIIDDQIINPQYLVDGLSVHTFKGWSGFIGQNSEDYHFVDANGIYTLQNGKKVYGLKSVSYIDDGSEYKQIYFNSIWDYNSNEVKVEILPKNIHAELKDLFIDTAGFSYEQSTNKVNFIVGSLIQLNIPQILGYTYFGYKIKGEEEIIQSYNLTMPNKDITIELYYKFNVSVKIDEKVKGANSAFVNDLQMYSSLYGEMVNLKAIESTTYDFVGWYVGDTLISEKLTVQTAVFDTTEFIAKFKLKQISVILNIDSNILTFELNNSMVSVGDQILLTLNYLNPEYSLMGLTLNGQVDKLIKTIDDKIISYKYTVTENDIETGLIKIEAITNLNPLSIKYKINYSLAGNVFVMDQSIIDVTKYYTFGEQLSLKYTVNQRYSFSDVLLNNKSIFNKFTVNSDILSLLISAELGFIANQENIITFVYSKLYWSEFTENYEGDGTKNNPYIINTEKQLAQIAYKINNGLEDQFTSQLYYKLNAGLNLQEYFWEPIGTKDNPFNGVFILGDLLVEGISLDPDQNYVLSWENILPGLFGYITKDAKIIFERDYSDLWTILISVGFVIISIAMVVIIVVKNKKKKFETLSNTHGNILKHEGLEDISTISIKNTNDKKIPKIKPKTLKEEMKNTNKNIKSDQDVLDNLEEYYNKQKRDN